jgi:hypothetical protein
MRQHRASVYLFSLLLQKNYFNMASIKNLKKDINYVLGDIIEAAIIFQEAHPENDAKVSEAIVDDAIATFDELIAKVNDKKVESRKVALTQVQVQLEQQAIGLIGRVNQLGA